MTIFIKDSLRASVEAASGGQITVLYTEKGQPSHMFVQNAFNIEDVDAASGTGLHPMFKVNGVEKAERFIGAYPGIVSDGELISLPGQDPTASLNFDTFLARARANGEGWGLMTNTDWSGIAMWCHKNGFRPRGNSNYGKSSDAPLEAGTRQDGLMPGNTSGTARTLTGSGPASWRHNNNNGGIADLCGNINEWAPGLRLMDGEIQVLKDNDAAMSTIDLSAASSEWRAIDGETGLLVAIGSANAVKVAATGTANYTIVAATSSKMESITNPGTTPVSEAGLKTLKLYGIYPFTSNMDGDGFYHNPEGERVPYRGGDWNSSALAGVSYLSLFSPRSVTNSGVGARPAFSL